MGYDLERPCGVGYCNVLTYPRLRDQMQKGTPAWNEAAPPEVPEARYPFAAGVVLLGLIICGGGGGAILLGLLVIAGGAAWWAYMKRAVADAEAALAAWKRRRYCLACDKRIAPEGGTYEAA